MVVGRIFQILADIQEASCISAHDECVMRQCRLNEELSREVRGEAYRPFYSMPELLVLKINPKRTRLNSTSVDRMKG